MPIDALVDTNVLVAAVVENHPHHLASSTLLLSQRPGTFAVAGHSFAELYVTLTKRTSGAPYAWDPETARAATDAFADHTRIIGLTHDQTLDAIRDYANAGGIGARLYDHLIGQAAVIARLGRLITWNVGHMRSLFPDLEVLTPEDAVALPTVKDRP